MSDAAKGAAILLYSPVTGAFLEDLTRNADRIFFFEEGPSVAPKLISNSLSDGAKELNRL